MNSHDLHEPIESAAQIVRNPDWANSLWNGEPMLVQLKDFERGSKQLINWLGISGTCVLR
jgi:hypothetical protein